MKDKILQKIKEIKLKINEHESKKEPLIETVQTLEKEKYKIELNIIEHNNKINELNDTLQSLENALEVVQYLEV